MGRYKKNENDKSWRKSITLPPKEGQKLERMADDKTHGNVSHMVATLIKKARE